jgi:hypothetical protein
MSGQGERSIAVGRSPRTISIRRAPVTMQLISSAVTPVCKPTVYTAAMKYLCLLIVGLCFAGGCGQSHNEPPRLMERQELKPNVGQQILIEGTARYQKVTGPLIAANDFQIRIYPRNLWGAEMDGKKVRVTGMLNDSDHSTPPDPSLEPGEYWLSDTAYAKPKMEH